MKSVFKNPKIYPVMVFIAAELAIYISFLTVQAVTASDPVILKYSGIILCLVFALYGCTAKKGDNKFVALALFYTAASDFFIFVLNDYYEIGVIIFIITQYTYYLRINHNLGRSGISPLIIRIAVCAFLIIILASVNLLFPLTALAAVYFVFLVANAVESVRLIKMRPTFILFLIGLILFIGCDVCVGLNNFGSFGIALPASVKGFVAVAMWAFYLPSQVLIVLSTEGCFAPFFTGDKNEK